MKEKIVQNQGFFPARFLLVNILKEIRIAGKKIAVVKIKNSTDFMVAGVKGDKNRLTAQRLA